MNNQQVNGYNNGYNGYNNGYNGNNMPPQRNNNTTTLILGIIGGAVLCGIIVLIILLVNKNGTVAEQVVEGSPRVDTVREVVVQEVQTIEQAPAKVKAQEVSNPQPVYSGPLKSGRNVMRGSFNYNGASYGFTLSFNYDPSTGRASNGNYTPSGYSANIKVTVNVSDGGRSISAYGKSTNIDMTSSGGRSYSGWMQRGDHSGSCTASL